MWPDLVTQIFNWITLLIYTTLWICVIINKRFIMVIVNTKQDTEELIQSSEKVEIMNMMNGDIKDSIKKQVHVFVLVFCHQ